MGNVTGESALEQFHMGQAQPISNLSNQPYLKPSKHDLKPNKINLNRTVTSVDSSIQDEKPGSEDEIDAEAEEQKNKDDYTKMLIRDEI